MGTEETKSDCASGILNRYSFIDCSLCSLCWGKPWRQFPKSKKGRFWKLGEHKRQAEPLLFLRHLEVVWMVLIFLKRLLDR